MLLKKSLGQNFLTSSVIAGKVTEAISVNNQDTVLEIGPGKGILTTELLKRAEKVVAIEKDPELIDFLNEKFAEEIKSNKLELILKDILDFSTEKLGKYKLAANIPYYITGEIFRKFLGDQNQPQAMSIMVQKEVAERITTKDCRESLLSISIKAYGEPKIAKTVSKGSFFPIPKVDSAILTIKNISKDFFKGITEKNFFNVVKTGFGHKRKVLINNLIPLCAKEKLEKIFKDLNLLSSIRAEKVSLTQWRELTKMIYSD